jgi:hypothetical protein
MSTSHITADESSRIDRPTLAPGTAITIVKLAPDGREAARYPGEVLAANDPPPWLTVRATWTYRTIELDGLSFHPGDQLVEWFSAVHWFNAFAVSSAEGWFRGWYANVTFPTRLDPHTDPPSLLWHDLYVDLVGLPDGTYTVRDDDELDASGLESRDPRLFARITAARTEIIDRFTRRLPPFGEDFALREDSTSHRRSSSQP